MVGEIFGQSREYRVAHARQELMWLARQEGWSFPMIARRFPNPKSKSGHMDHTSVIWACKQHEKRRREAALDRVALENEISALAHGGR